MGFNQIFCLIDMDNKRKDQKSMNDYLKLKKKYHDIHVAKPKKGIDYVVRFYETDRCTELFFLYYFRYTAQEFLASNDISAMLNKVCGYEKTLRFFRSHPLDPFFERKGGSFALAIKNAERSMKEKESGLRDYIYSEIGKMFFDLGI